MYIERETKRAGDVHDDEVEREGSVSIYVYITAMNYLSYMYCLFEVGDRFYLSDSQTQARV